MIERGQKSYRSKNTPGKTEVSSDYAINVWIQQKEEIYTNKGTHTFTQVNLIKLFNENFNRGRDGKRGFQIKLRS